MIERFLKAKHWQLFLLTFGIPMLLQFIGMGYLISNISTQTNPDFRNIINYIGFSPFIMIIFTAIFYGWFWSIAIGLQNKLPKNINMKIKRFKIFFFVPIIYYTLFTLAFVWIITSIITSETMENELVFNPTFIAGLLLIIIPLHLFSIFCMFYSLYFAAKTLKTVELQRETSFSDFAGEFVSIWFYPIGIWIIQPKINKIIED